MVPVQTSESIDSLFSGYLTQKACLCGRRSILSSPTWLKASPCRRKKKNIVSHVSPNLTLEQPFKILEYFISTCMAIIVVIMYMTWLETFQNKYSSLCCMLISLQNAILLVAKGIEHTWEKMIFYFKLQKPITWKRQMSLTNGTDDPRMKSKSMSCCTSLFFSRNCFTLYITWPA